MEKFKKFLDFSLILLGIAFLVSVLSALAFPVVGCYLLDPSILCVALMSLGWLFFYIGPTFILVYFLRENLREESKFSLRIIFGKYEGFWKRRNIFSVIAVLLLFLVLVLMLFAS